MAFSQPTYKENLLSEPKNDSIIHMKRSPLRMAIEQNLWFIPWVMSALFAYRLFKEKM